MLKKPWQKNKGKLYNSLLSKKCEYRGADMKFSNVALCTLIVSLLVLLSLTNNLMSNGISESSFKFEVMWSKTFGGNKNDVCTAMIKTLDGGYALAGYTESYGAGYQDFWLVKTDSSGNLIWSKTFGGSGGHDSAWALLQTGEGGFVLFGSRQEYIGGRSSYWLVRTDSSGNMQWNKTFKPTAAEDGHFTQGTAYGSSLVRTSDGGYLLAGQAVTSYTYNEQYKGFIENDDFWLVKTDQFGNEEWNNTFDSGGLRDWSYSVVEASWFNGGGYAVLGLASSGTGETWNEDFWLVKIDLQGNMQWNKKFDKSSIDRGYSLIEIPNTEGYLLAGPTHTDFWIIKTNKNGQVQWDKTYTSTGTVGSVSLLPSIDGGYISAWESTLIKTDGSGNETWRKNIYEHVGYNPSVVAETAESEYVIAGSKEVSSGNNDFSLTKLAVSQTQETPIFYPWLWVVVGLGIAVAALTVTIVYFTKKKKAVSA